MSADGADCEQRTGWTEVDETELVEDIRLCTSVTNLPFEAGLELIEIIWSETISFYELRDSRVPTVVLCKVDCCTTEILYDGSNSGVPSCLAVAYTIPRFPTQTAQFCKKCNPSVYYSVVHISLKEVA